MIYFIQSSWLHAFQSGIVILTRYARSHSSNTPFLSLILHFAPHSRWILCLSLILCMPGCDNECWIRVRLCVCLFVHLFRLIAVLLFLLFLLCFFCFIPYVYIETIRSRCCVWCYCCCLFVSLLVSSFDFCIFIALL